LEEAKKRLFGNGGSLFLSDACTQFAMACSDTGGSAAPPNAGPARTDAKREFGGYAMPKRQFSCSAVNRRRSEMFMNFGCLCCPPLALVSAAKI
jgi:hypothetical protein